MGPANKALFAYSTLFSFFILISGILSSTQSSHLFLQIAFIPVPLYLIIKLVNGSFNQSAQVSSWNLGVSLVLLAPLLIIGFLGARSKRFVHTQRDETPLIINTQSAVPMPATQTIEVNIAKDSFLNLRSEPNTQSSVAGQAYKGDRFESTEKDGDWYKIILENGGFAYIQENYVYEILEQ